MFPMPGPFSTFLSGRSLFPKTIIVGTKRVVTTPEPSHIISKLISNIISNIRVFRSNTRRVWFMYTFVRCIFSRMLKWTKFTGR